MRLLTQIHSLRHFSFIVTSYLPSVRFLSLIPLHTISDIRNIGIAAHIDAGKTTTTERMLFYAGTQRRVGEVDAGTTTTDYLEDEAERGITITAACVTLEWKDQRDTKNSKALVNLIDTPGHVDFAIEVQRSLSVLDGVVALFDAAVGVQAQSHGVLTMARRVRAPMIAFMNKMDKSNANHVEAIRSLEVKLGVLPLPLQLPLFSDRGEFEGVVDLFELEAHRFAGPHGSNVQTTHIQNEGSDVIQQIKEARTLLVERLADYDEHIADAWLNASETDANAAMTLPASLLRDAVRAQLLQSASAHEMARAIGTSKPVVSMSGLQDTELPVSSLPSAWSAFFCTDLGKTVMVEKPILPVFFGASRRNIGVQPLLNAIVDLMPSPLARPPLLGVDTKGHPCIAPHPIAGAGPGVISRMEEFLTSIKSSPKLKHAPESISFVFKLTRTIRLPDGSRSDRSVRKRDTNNHPLVIFRVHCGRITKGSRLINRRTGKTIIVGELFLLHADAAKPVTELTAGMIAAAQFPECATGDTLAGKPLGAMFNQRIYSEPKRERSLTEASASLERFFAFEPIVPPRAVLSYAVEAENLSEHEQVRVALREMAAEDPTLGVTENRRGQQVLSGMGELHLEITLSHLRRAYGLDASFHRAIIDYREGIVTSRHVDNAQGTIDGIPSFGATIELYPDVYDDPLIGSSPAAKLKKDEQSSTTSDSNSSGEVMQAARRLTQSHGKSTTALGGKEGFDATMNIADFRRKLMERRQQRRQTAIGSIDISVQKSISDEIKERMAGRSLTEIVRSEENTLLTLELAFDEAARNAVSIGPLSLRTIGLRFQLQAFSWLQSAPLASFREVEHGTLVNSFSRILSKLLHQSDSDASLGSAQNQAALFEPMMEMELELTDPSYISDVLKALHGRHATFTDVQGTVIHAVVPLRTTVKFAAEVRKAAKGNVYYWTTLRCYRMIVDDDVRKRILQSILQ